jgi:uncharacterized protein (TIGR03435 family)
MTYKRRNIEEFLRQHIRSARKEEMESDAARVLDRLRSENEWDSDRPVRESSVDPIPAPSRKWRRLASLPVAATVIILLLIAIGSRRDAFAVVESVDGVLFKVVDGRDQSIHPGERIAARETIRSDGAAGSTIVMADGSHLEMRSKSKLSLEKADDGVRIRLSEGGVIINAASHRNGPLYVDTKDVSVSVFGTVFFVNVEEEGSRVVVIEGEVHVQQGTSLKKLLQGEQVSTGRSVETIPVAEEISWSRHAPTHLALLQQELASPPVSPSSTQSAPQLTPTPSFEAASIKRNNDPTCRQFLCGITTQPRSGRLIIQNQTLLSIVRTAYGVRADDIVGGPSWRDKDKFDIEAKAEGPVAEATLFVMLRSLLADRFKLMIRHETREMPMYTLRLSKNGPKLQKVADGNDAQLPARVSGGGGRGGCGAMAIGSVGSLQQLGDAVSYAAGIRQFAGRASIPQLANFLTALVGCRPVLDRTDLPGVFDMRAEWMLSPRNEFYVPGVPDPAMGSALEDQLGLKLEMQKGLGEVLVIDSVEQPSEN